MVEIEVVSQSGGLRDLVPEILNVAVPEFSDLSLVGGAGCAVDEAEALEFIEGLCVGVAGELRGWAGAEFVGVP